MTLGRTLAGIAALSMIATPVAVQAGTIGTLQSVNGNVFVARDGGMMPATASMALRSGDRVMTRVGSSAQVSYGGCSSAVAGASVFTVGASCDTQARNFASLQDNDDDSGTGTGPLGGEGGAGFGTAIVAALAVVAAGLGIYIAVDSDSNDAPVSA